MKLLVVFLLMTSQVFAKDMCSRWTKERYVKAIEVVAQAEGVTPAELCSMEKLLDVEVQPSQTFTREGKLVPCVRVQLHGEYSSCLYLIKDEDWSILEQRCYSGW